MIPTENHHLSVEEQKCSTGHQNLCADIICEEPAVISCEYKNFCDQEVRENSVEDDLFSLTPKPELQRIREEQIRQWLAYDQQQQLQELLIEGQNHDHIFDSESAQFCADAVHQRNRKVRFLTDSEGNLIITVFLTNLRESDATQEASINMSEETETQTESSDESQLCDNNRAYSSSSGSVTSSSNDDDDPLFEKACSKAAADEKSMCGHITLVVKAEINNANNESTDSDVNSITDDGFQEICEEPSCVDEEGVESDVLDQLDDFLGGVDDNEDATDVSSQIRDLKMDATTLPAFSHDIIDTGNVSEESSCGSNDEKTLCSAHFELEKKRMETPVENTNQMTDEKDETESPQNELKENFVESEISNQGDEKNKDKLLEEDDDFPLNHSEHFETKETTDEIITDAEKPLKSLDLCAEAEPIIAAIEPQVKVEQSNGLTTDKTFNDPVAIIPDENNNVNLCQELIEAENELYHMSINHIANDHDDKYGHDMLEGVKQSVFDGLGITNEDEKALVSLRIEEEHLSSVALSIQKWESLSRKKGGGPKLPIQPAVYNYKGKLAQTAGQMNKIEISGYNNNDEKEIVVTEKNNETNDENNNRKSGVEEKKMNDKNTSQQTQNEQSDSNTDDNMIITPSVIKNGNGCWNVWMKGEKGDNSDNKTEEIIYAQPNGLTGVASVMNQTEVLKSFCRPNSKGDIVNWFKEGELYRSGILLSSWGPAVSLGGSTSPPVVVSWFFGLITRAQAENFLHGQPQGTFLVRISTRIWGYTLSYQTNQKIKHFLISAINPAVAETMKGTKDFEPKTYQEQLLSPFLPQGRYSFIGTHTTPYHTLASLIRHHSHAPITKAGGEKLIHPCPGGPNLTGIQQVFK